MKISGSKWVTFFGGTGRPTPVAWGVPLGGQRPPEPENFFAFLTSGKALSGHRRAKIGQLGTPKISPIGLELIFLAGFKFFLAGFKFLWAGFFFWARI